MPPHPTPLRSGELTPTRTNGAFVYRAYAADGCLLYVGLTGDVVLRIGEHHRDKSPWVRYLDRVTWEEYRTRYLAERVEQRLIRELRPQYNLSHNEDAPPPPCPHPTAPEAREMLGDLIEQAAWTDDAAVARLLGRRQ